jgi:hypothetical protein
VLNDTGASVDILVLPSHFFIFSYPFLLMTHIGKVHYWAYPSVIHMEQAHTLRNPKCVNDAIYNHIMVHFNIRFWKDGKMLYVDNCIDDKSKRSIYLMLRYR